jgi:hypothetical protein
VITALIAGRDVSIADGWIVAALELTEVDLKLVFRAPKLIGLRNEKGEIYRVIGTTGMSQFLEAFVQLSDLCLDVEIHRIVDSNERDFDAIFSVPPRIKKHVSR